MVLADLVAEPVCVHLRMLRERRRDGFQKNVVDRDLEFVAQLQHRFAHLDDACEIELRGEIERRDGADGFGESARDRLSNLGKCDVLVISAAARGRYCGRRSRGRRFDVTLDDPAARPGALYAGDVESPLARDAAGEW